MKHSYSININVSIGILRHQLFNIWGAPIEQLESLFNELISLFSKNVVPVRPNRAFTRKKSIAKRRNLFTTSNFRRSG